MASFENVKKNSQQILKSWPLQAFKVSEICFAGAFFNGSHDIVLNRIFYFAGIHPKKIEKVVFLIL